MEHIKYLDLAVGTQREVWEPLLHSSEEHIYVCVQVPRGSAVAYVSY